MTQPFEMTVVAVECIGATTRDAIPEVIEARAFRVIDNDGTVI